MVFQFFVNDFQGDSTQYRFPRTKKQRIRKKWRKQRSNYRFFPDYSIYEVQGKLIMHPATLEKLKKERKRTEVEEYLRKR